MTNPRANQAPFGRRAPLLQAPKGDILGTYETYLEAQRVVDRLAKADFEVGRVSIVGNDLKTVERVTRKLSWNRAALEGALSGAWFGLFLGLLFSFFSEAVSIGFFAAAVFIGAAFGLFFRLMTYAVNRRTRDFESTSQVLASNYQIIVDPDLTMRAQELLARTPGE